MSFVQRLLASWRGRAIVLAVLAAVVGGPVLVSRATAAPPPAALRTAGVARGSITQTVAVSGSINAIASYKLSFKLQGAGTSLKLTEVLVAVGDQVQKDQPLARIDASDLRTALAAAQNNLDTAQARYDSIVAGADPREVADAKRALDKVSTSYATAKNTYQQNVLTLQQDLRSLPEKLVALKDQMVKAQYRLSVVGQPIGTPQPPTTEPPALTPEPTLSTAKADARSATTSMNQAQAAREAAETTTNDTLASALGEFNAAYANVQSGIRAFDAAIATGGDTTQAIAFFQTTQATYTTAAARLATAIDAVSASIASVSSSVGSASNAIQSGGSRNENNLDGARYELAQTQTQIVQLQQMLSGDKSKITQAGSSVTTISDTVGGSYQSSQSALQKVTATPKPTDVLSALSTLQSAKTALQSAQDNLDGATLKAPSPGTIATVLNQVGENVSGTVMTLANNTSLTLRGTIGEADVAKLRLGQVATVTVDAVGATATSRMTGKVSSIDPVATIQQGVPVYGVDVQVDIQAAGVRPGMSGTAQVIIASRQQILTVPNLAIRAQGTRRYVLTLRNGESVETNVTFGIANDTVTEVQDGLTESDIVVLPQLRSTASGAPRQQLGGPGGPPPGFGR